MSGDCSLRLEFKVEGFVFMESFLPQTQAGSNSPAGITRQIFHSIAVRVARLVRHSSARNSFRNAATLIVVL